MNRYILSIAGLATVLVIAQQGLVESTEAKAPLEPNAVVERELALPVPEIATDTDLNRASLFQF